VEYWNSGVYMTENITYGLLWEILQKERSSNSLQLVPKNFYNEVFDFIKDTETKNSTSEEVSVQTANMKRLLMEIFEKRKQKIILYVAYKKPMPSPTVDIELDLYNKLTDLYLNTKIISQETTKAQQNRLRVIIEKLPEVFLPSGLKIGPLEKGQVIEVADKTDSAFLIDNSLCVYEKL
jgi:hypothetical protein